MVTSISSLNSATVFTAASDSTPKLLSNKLQDEQPRDSVEFGKNGALSMEQSMNIVVERALDKLRSVVEQARAELGLPEDAVIDTSAEATGDRIATFALGAWDKYAKLHKLEDNEDGRKQFADFIGGAINQGISEARGILGALNALSSDVDANINKTSDIIQQRLQDFVANGLSKK